MYFYTVRNITLLIVLAFSFTQSICSSWISSVKLNYQHYPIIFYGELIDCKELKDAYDIYGYPFVVQNFKIKQKIKGVTDDLWGDSIISIRSISNLKDTTYCKADRGKMYIIYASDKTFINSGCFPYVDFTFPSREIENGDLSVKESLLKEEIGKNELELLLKYKNNDTTDNMIIAPFDEVKWYKARIEEQSNLIEQNNRTIKLTIAIFTSTILLLLILFFRKRLKNIARV